jgi:hypothetical protein
MVLDAVTTTHTELNYSFTCHCESFKQQNILTLAAELQTVSFPAW